MPLLLKNVLKIWDKIALLVFFAAVHIIFLFSCLSFIHDVFFATIEPPVIPELEPEVDRSHKEKKKKDKNRLKTEDKNDQEDNVRKSVKEEVTNTNKLRKSTPTQPVTGNTTHSSDDLNQPDGQTAIKKDNVQCYWTHEYRTTLGSVFNRGNELCWCFLCLYSEG